MTEQERIEALKPKVTKEFMATLEELAKIYGWSGDLTEIQYFSNWINIEFFEFYDPDPIDPY